MAGLFVGGPLFSPGQDLKDFGREAGDVLYTSVSSNGDGTGVIEFSKESHMEWALKNLDGKKFRSHMVGPIVCQPYPTGRLQRGHPEGGSGRLPCIQPVTVSSPSIAQPAPEPAPERIPAPPQPIAPSPQPIPPSPQSIPPSPQPIAAQVPLKVL